MREWITPLQSGRTEKKHIVPRAAFAWHRNKTTFRSSSLFFCQTARLTAKVIATLVVTQMLLISAGVLSHFTPVPCGWVTTHSRESAAAASAAHRNRRTPSHTLGHADYQESNARSQFCAPPRTFLSRRFSSKFSRRKSDLTDECSISVTHTQPSFSRTRIVCIRAKNAWTNMQIKLSSS